MRRFILPLLLLSGVARAGSPSDNVWHQLADPDFTVREQATQELLAMGPAIRSQLAAQSVTGPLEKRERCARLLRIIDLGLDPKLPADAIDALVGYDYDTPAEDKMRRIGRFRAAAVAGSTAALRLGVKEPDADIRQQIFNISDPRAVSAYVSLLVDTPAPDLAAIEAYGRAYERFGASHNALTLQMTALRLTGRLEGEIAEALTIANRTPADSFRLASLLYLAGRDVEATAEAGLHSSPLRSIIAIGANDWPALLTAQRTAPATEYSTVAQITARRLSGDAAGAQEQLRDWVAGQAFTENEPRRRRAAAVACLINDMPGDGVELYAGVASRAGLLRLHGRWAEAVTEATASGGAELDLIRREIGEAPLPAVPPKIVLPPVPLAPVLAPDDPKGDLAAAAEAWHRGDATAALAALNGVPAGSPDIDAAKLLTPLCLEQLGRAYDALVARKAVDIRMAARSQGWTIALGRLDAAGLESVADAEVQRFSRTWPDNTRVIADLARRAAARATAKKDWPAASAAVDRLLAAHAMGTVSFTDPTGYLTAPFNGHWARARIAWDAGDWAVAIEHARLATACLPIDGRVAIEFVPKLAAVGDTAAADALFDPTWQRAAELFRQYPKAARLRNVMAWMALRCDRHLDEALKLAEEAVALQPDNEAYLDTLAEALFRNDRKGEAITRLRQAVALRPDDKLLKERLQGFEQGRVVVGDPR